jgi:nucleotide-binding universal stress UspA family protein
VVYKHAIIPMDGSGLAECVLSHFKSLADASLIEEVELVRVVPPIEGHYKAVISLDSKDEQRINQAAQKEAEEYLQKIKASLTPSGIKVTTRILVGSIANTLADYIKNSNADLLLLSTHGRSGLSRWIWGSVAEKVLHSTSIPIFLVRPPGCKLGM